MEYVVREEAKKVVERELQKSKQLRRAQVRQQSVQWTDETRRKFEAEKERQIKVLANALTAQAQANAMARIEQINIEHDLALAEVGAAHRAAAAVQDVQRIRDLKRLQNSELAKQRGASALRNNRLRNEKRNEDKSNVLKRKEQVRQAEDYKAKDLVRRKPFKTSNKIAETEKSKRVPGAPEYEQRIAKTLAVAPAFKGQENEMTTSGVKKSPKKRPVGSPVKTQNIQKHKEPGETFSRFAKEADLRQSNGSKRHEMGTKTNLSSKGRVSNVQTKKKVQPVRFYDASIPKPVAMYIPPAGLAEAEHEVNSDAWEKALTLERESAITSRKKEEIKEKREKTIKERGKNALQLERLSKELMHLTRELANVENDKDVIYKPSLENSTVDQDQLDELSDTPTADLSSDTISGFYSPPPTPIAPLSPKIDSDGNSKISSDHVDEHEPDAPDGNHYKGASNVELTRIEKSDTKSSERSVTPDNTNTTKMSPAVVEKTDKIVDRRSPIDSCPVKSQKLERRSKSPSPRPQELPKAKTSKGTKSLKESPKLDNVQVASETSGTPKPKLSSGSTTSYYSPPFTSTPDDSRSRLYDSSTFKVPIGKHESKALARYVTKMLHMRRESVEKLQLSSSSSSSGISKVVADSYQSDSSFLSSVYNSPKSVGNGHDETSDRVDGTPQILPSVLEDEEETQFVPTKLSSSGSTELNISLKIHQLSGSSISRQSQMQTLESSGGSASQRRTSQNASSYFSSRSSGGFTIPQVDSFSNSGNTTTDSGGTMPDVDMMLRKLKGLNNSNHSDKRHNGSISSKKEHESDQEIPRGIENSVELDMMFRSPIYTMTDHAEMLSSVFGELKSQWASMSIERPPWLSS